MDNRNLEPKDLSIRELSNIEGAESDAPTNSTTDARQDVGTEGIMEVVRAAQKDRLSPEQAFDKRLSEYLRSIQMPRREFERSIGAYHAWSKHIKPNSAKLLNFKDKIIEAHPMLNFEWLNNGLGQMITDDAGEWITERSSELLEKECPSVGKIKADVDRLGVTKLLVENAKKIFQQGLMPVPVVTIHAKAGYLSGYGDPEFLESLPIEYVMADKEYKGEYRIFVVSGDSMDDGTSDAIKDGDHILCRSVDPLFWSSPLPKRKWTNWVFVTKTEGIVVKEIEEQNMENGMLRLKSKNKEYGDFELFIEDCLEIYSVIEITRRRL